MYVPNPVNHSSSCSIIITSTVRVADENRTRFQDLYEDDNNCMLLSNFLTESLYMRRVQYNTL